MYTSRIGSALALGVMLVVSLSCQDEQQPVATTPGALDILWIVDSSNSMAGNQADLAASFATFAGTLADRDPTLDYRVGVTTTQALPCDQDPHAFDGCEDSLGNTGRLRGLANVAADTSHSPSLPHAQDANLIADFQALVDVGVDGSTVEYGLWSAALAVCASVDLPFDSDFSDWDSDTPWECSGTNWDTSHPWAEFCRCLPQELHDYNVDGSGDRFLRDGATLLVVVVSDEGDATPDLGEGSWPWDLSNCSLGDPWPTSVQDRCASDPATLCPNYCKIDRFVEFFDSLERDVVVATIAPCAELAHDGFGYYVDFCCPDQNPTDPAMEFYLWAPELTEGTYSPIDIYEDGLPCAEDAVAPAMAGLAQLVIDMAGGS